MWCVLVEVVLASADLKLLSLCRKWHRLYATSLFVSDIVLASSAATMDKVCDIAGCDVAAKPGDVPYVFIVCNKEGVRFEFQASPSSCH